MVSKDAESYLFNSQYVKVRNQKKTRMLQKTGQMIESIFLFPNSKYLENDGKGHLTLKNNSIYIGQLDK